MKVTVSCFDDIFTIPFKSKEIPACIDQVCTGENINKGAIGIIFANSIKIREINNQFIA